MFPKKNHHQAQNKRPALYKDTHHNKIGRGSSYIAGGPRRSCPRAVSVCGILSGPSRFPWHNKNKFEVFWKDAIRKEPGGRFLNMYVKG
jgi:hypothetical protein